MASGRPTIAQLRGWPGAVGFGLAASWAAAHGPERLVHGGLAPLAATALAAAFLAAPLARLEWRTGPIERAGGRWAAARRFAGALGPMWGVLLVAAAAAPSVRAAGGAGLVAAGAVWAGLALVAPRVGGAPAFGLAAAALVIASGGAIATSAEAPPWTLLDPRWETWRAWLPGAVAAGFALAAPGFGHWSGWPSPPGERRAPWLTAGLALLLALAVSVWGAAAYEAHAALTQAAPGLAPLGAAAGAAALVARPLARSTLAWRAAGGFAATLWFAGPAFEALPLWWASLLPIGPAVVAAALATAHAGPARWYAALCAAVALGVAALGWPGLPESAGAAAAIAVVGVAAVWVAGTAAALPTQEVPS